MTTTRLALLPLIGVVAVLLIHSVAFAKFEFDLEARHLLMKAYFDNGEWLKLKSLVSDTLETVPKDPPSLSYERAGTEASAAEIHGAEKLIDEHPNAERQLDLSFAYFRAGRFKDCITAARAALKMKADYPEAFNNIGSASIALGQWNDAIRAEQSALRIRPDYALAKENLALAKAKAKTAGK